MKATFFSKLLNDPFSDPVLLIRFKREKEAFLFDAGDTSSLSMKEIQKISHIFITHMHIDHFIGFDYILRSILYRERPLIVYGPVGIIEAVDGKLRGYTWNLIKEYPLRIEVYEIKDNTKLHSSFYAPEGFRRIDRKEDSNSKTIHFNIDDRGLYVDARIFDHGIPLLGYSLKEDYHINIDKSILLKKKLPVGKWLKEFKSNLRIGINDKVFDIDGKRYNLNELRDLAIITKGQKLTYITDISPEEKNINNAIELARESDTLYIEAFFLDEDRERAFNRNHLTAKIAGIIAKEAGVKNLVLIHISPKYTSDPEKVIEEAMREFKR